MLVTLAQITASMHTFMSTGWLLQGETLFRTVIEVTGGGGAAGGSSGSSEAAVRTALEDYMARLPEPLNIIEVQPVTLMIMTSCCIQIA